MSTIPSKGNLDDADQEYEIIAQCLEHFLEAWDACDSPPALSEFIPGDGKVDRRLVLAELIKVDLEYRWQERNFPKRITEYFSEFPELLQDGNAPADLIYEEFHVRVNSGFPVEPKEYFDQFPDQAEELGRLLGIHQPFQSTSICGGLAARQKLLTIEPGAQFEDFDLLSMLGEGAFARVFLAHQRSMQRMVALKITTDTGAEPQTLAQFDHDNIVRVFDQRALPEEKLHLLYMQYLSGGTLEPLVKQIRERNTEETTGQLLVDTVRSALESRGETMSLKADWVTRVSGFNWPETVCWIGAQLASALNYTHERGVLHRDIKPANILLSAEGLPKLADFNVSFSSKVAGITPSTFFGGSLAYMSPEQLEACDPAHARDPDSLDGRSDLYSLGVVLWELLTGRRPFPDEKVKQDGDESVLKQLTRLRKQGLQDPFWSQLPANCPPGLIRVLKRCLASEIEKRFVTGDELARQLDLCTNPRIQRLLHPPTKGVVAWLRRHATGMVFLAAAIPNILAGWFNFEYNHAEIILHLSEETQSTFYRLAAIVNMIAYPIGLVTIFWLTSSVVAGIKRMDRGEGVPRDRLQKLRQRSLKLGHYVAVTCVSLWGAAGLAYPLSLLGTAGDMDLWDCLHFFGSLLVCGLIAAAYPFFGTTYFSLRALYPGLLVDDVSASNDTSLLRWVSTACWVYLGIAILVPFMAVMGIVVRLVVEQQRSIHSIYLLGWLTLASFVGLILMIVFLRPLQKDLATLIDTLDDK